MTSLSSRLALAIKERDRLAEAMNAFRRDHGQYVKYEEYWALHSAWHKADEAIQDIESDNESAILNALQFLEAVERHGMRVRPATDGRGWVAEFGWNSYAHAATPAEAVRKLVEQLEKAK